MCLDSNGNIVTEPLTESTLQRFQLLSQKVPPEDVTKNVEMQCNTQWTFPERIHEVPNTNIAYLYCESTDSLTKLKLDNTGFDHGSGTYIQITETLNEFPLKPPTEKNGKTERKKQNSLKLKKKWIKECYAIVCSGNLKENVKNFWHGKVPTTRPVKRNINQKKIDPPLS